MRKHFVSILSIISIFTLIFNTAVFAAPDSGKIDFFKVFSNNNEESINRIGNSIHNWSIYFPSDAVVNKNTKATTFYMTSNSYKIDASVNVLQNVHNLSFEELFANTLSIENSGYMDYDGTYICSSGIKQGKTSKYILISSITPQSYLYSGSDSQDEQGTYNEKRIYLGTKNKTDYIYIVSLSMDFQYYKQHPNLFSKIADSFETSFDQSNPNIKDLSEQVNTFRVFQNRIYGWKIELAPYWKLQGAETSMNQTFMPLYSDSEIGDESDLISEDNEVSSANKIKDALTVNVISSAPADMDFNQWSDHEINKIINNYNKKLFTIICKTQPTAGSALKSKQLLYEIKSSSTETMVTAVTFVQGNGYRYKVSLSMTKSKYQEKSGKDTFERMLNSFSLVNSKSSFVKELTPSEAVFNYAAPRTISMKKYNLKIITNNNWIENYNIFDGQLDDPMYSSSFFSNGSSQFYSDGSTNESLTVNHSNSGTQLSVMAESSTDSIEKSLKSLLTEEFSRQDITSGIMNMKLYKSTFNNSPVYKIAETYNLEKMQNLSSGNNNKSFNYTELYDSYTYVFKQNDDLYVIMFSIPFMNTSDENLEAIESIWNNIKVNGINIGSQSSVWQQVDTAKYKDAAQ